MPGISNTYDMERRTAPDGRSYTQEEFSAYFGGLREWHKAEPCRVCGLKWDESHTRHASVKVHRDDDRTVVVRGMPAEFPSQELRRAFGGQGEVEGINQRVVSHSRKGRPDKVELIAEVRFRDSSAAWKVAAQEDGRICDEWLVRAKAMVVPRPAAQVAPPAQVYTGSMMPAADIAKAPAVTVPSLASIMAEQQQKADARKAAFKAEQQKKADSKAGFKGQQQKKPKQAVAQQPQVQQQPQEVKVAPQKAIKKVIRCAMAREGDGCTVLVRDLPTGMPEDEMSSALCKAFAEHGELAGSPRVVENLGVFVTLREKGSAERAQALMHKTRWAQLGLTAGETTGLGRASSAEAA